MADNFDVTAGTGTTIRAVEKTSKKAQVVVLDLGGAGAESLLTTTLPVSLASNTPTLAAGSNAIGKLAANSGVDIGDVDVTSISAGTNTIGGTRDAGPAWTSVWGVSGAAVVSADMTTATAVTDAPTGGQKICLDDLVISTDTAMNVLVEAETSGTDLFKIFVPANGTVQLTMRGKVKLATADKKVTCKASVSGNIAVTASYHSEA